jgi:hypothetical protein
VSEEYECITRDEKGGCKIWIPKKKKDATLRVTCKDPKEMEKWAEVIKRFSDPTVKKRIVLEPE